MGAQNIRSCDAVTIKPTGQRWRQVDGYLRLRVMDDWARR
jgi:hypothetical protein